MADAGIGNTRHKVGFFRLVFGQGPSAVVADLFGVDSLIGGGRIARSRPIETNRPASRHLEAVPVSNLPG